MEVKFFAATKLGHVSTDQEISRMAGLTAGMCYAPDNGEKLKQEPQEKSEKRANMILQSGHHSPFDNIWFTLELTNVPKIVAMMINNEKFYNTSEKSARYKMMELPENEKLLYDKWKTIFVDEINKIKSGHENWLTDKKIEKLAQENARYMTSVFTPTSMFHTLSYRQLNILYGLIEKEIDLLESEQDGFSIRLRDSLIEFNKEIGKLETENGKPIIDKTLASNSKQRSLSLFRRDCRPVIKQAGEVYCWAYDGSFAQLAQAQRHRTISYQMNMSSIFEHKCYIPPIIADNEKLSRMWIEDFLTLDSTPQGTMVEIVEKGDLDGLILKSKERLCTCAQLEINKQTYKTILGVRDQMIEDGNPYAHDLDSYLAGSRCKAGYKCTTPCEYAPGINGERII